jgi:hypothetical protein
MLYPELEELYGFPLKEYLLRLRTETIYPRREEVFGRTPAIPSKTDVLPVQILSLPFR